MGPSSDRFPWTPGILAPRPCHSRTDTLWLTFPWHRSSRHVGPPTMSLSLLHPHGSSSARRPGLLSRRSFSTSTACCASWHGLRRSCPASWMRGSAYARQSSASGRRIAVWPLPSLASQTRDSCRFGGVVWWVVHHCEVAKMAPALLSRVQVWHKLKPGRPPACNRSLLTCREPWWLGTDVVLVWRTSALGARSVFGKHSTTCVLRMPTPALSSPIEACTWARTLPCPRRQPTVGQCRAPARQVCVVLMGPSCAGARPPCQDVCWTEAGPRPCLPPCADRREAPAESPTRYAEVALGKAAPSRHTQQFLKFSNQVRGYQTG